MPTPAYAEARKYTSNVVKVYSPNATWSRVKAAVVDASVVIYMGHGNGWPSPYTFDPNYTTKDGFGLNATAGAGDYNNKYYGEPYMASIDLAPGAIVLLHHLCYASGNSEPGHAEPSVTTARQRADNYATGFLKAGASAVIADGHSGAERYLQALFTTHQSIEDMWRTMPNQNGNVVKFASMRTPGVSVYQDPETPTSGFYRSLAIGTIGVTTDEVISAGYGDTGADPIGLSVPGNAAVSTEGAGLYSGPDTTAPPAATLPAGTRLRVVDQPNQVSAEGDTARPGRGTRRRVDRRLHGRHRPRPARQRGAGRSRARPGRSVLAERRRAGRHDDDQRAASPKPSPGPSASATTTTTWCSRRPAAASRSKRPGTGLSTATRSRTAPTTVSVSGVDDWDNAPANATRSVRVDTDAPSLEALSPGADTTQWFSPNGDGVPRHGLRQRDATPRPARSSPASSTPTARPSRAGPWATGAPPRR